MGISEVRKVELTHFPRLILYGVEVFYARKMAYLGSVGKGLSTGILASIALTLSLESHKLVFALMTLVCCYLPFFYKPQ